MKVRMVLLLLASLTSHAIAQDLDVKAYWSKKRQMTEGVSADSNQAPDPKENGLQVVGKAPDGFGHGFHWNRKEKVIELCLFLNTQDPMGICISNLKSGDVVEVSSAVGEAWFAKHKGNPIAASLVGPVAQMIEVGSKLAEIPGVDRLIKDAKAHADKEFKASGELEKRRNPFGQDPKDGHHARQEGGVMVCLPGAGQIYTSADNDKSRWMKRHDWRVDDIRPDHVKHGYFLIPPGENPHHNKRTLETDGEVYISVWDWKFDDNAGYYQVRVRLRRND